MKTLFWQRLDELIRTSEIVIDHPKDNRGVSEPGIYLRHHHTAGGIKD
jgi:hypothetical protein